MRSRPSPGFIFYWGCGARPRILAPPLIALKLFPSRELLPASGLLHLPGSRQGRLGHRGGSETGVLVAAALGPGCRPLPQALGSEGPRSKPLSGFPPTSPAPQSPASKNGRSLPPFAKDVILEIGGLRPPPAGVWRLPMTKPLLKFPDPLDQSTGRLRWLLESRLQRYIQAQVKCTVAVSRSPRAVSR